MYRWYSENSAIECRTFPIMQAMQSAPISYIAYEKKNSAPMPPSEHIRAILGQKIPKNPLNA